MQVKQVNWSRDSRIALGVSGLGAFTNSRTLLQANEVSFKKGNISNRKLYTVAFGTEKQPDFLPKTPRQTHRTKEFESPLKDRKVCGCSRLTSGMSLACLEILPPGSRRSVQTGGCPGFSRTAATLMTPARFLAQIAILIPGTGSGRGIGTCKNTHKGAKRDSFGQNTYSCRPWRSGQSPEFYVDPSG